MCSEDNDYNDDNDDNDDNDKDSDGDKHNDDDDDDYNDEDDDAIMVTMIETMMTSATIIKNCIEKKE